MVLGKILNFNIKVNLMGDKAISSPSSLKIEILDLIIFCFPFVRKQAKGQSR